MGLAIYPMDLDLLPSEVEEEIDRLHLTLCAFTDYKIVHLVFRPDDKPQMRVAAPIDDIDG